MIDMPTDVFSMKPLQSCSTVQVEALAGEALARIAAHPALLLPKVAA